MSENHFHRRIICLSYFEDEMKKLEGLPRQELEQAVGRLVLYGLANGQDQDTGQDTAQVVNISPCYGNEVQAAYFGRKPLRDCEYAIDRLLDGVNRDLTFVIGAVYREGEKKFSFHS